MSKVPKTELSMERRLLDMPYEVVFEIFDSLSMNKLIEISRLCAKLRDIAGDSRLWKDVHIRYEPYEGPTYLVFAFEELYSQPWPVKVIDLSHTRINRPVSLQIDQVVKVTTLNLSSITTADKATLEAILTKYQCTDLYLDFHIRIGHHQGHVTEIAPKIFLKQTALETLSLSGVIPRLPYFNSERGVWLAEVLWNCKNLKTLDLNYAYLTYSEMRYFVRRLPASLEKLLIKCASAADNFFKLLAKRCPNLRELELPCRRVAAPALRKFQFFEVLHVTPGSNEDINDYLGVYLITFPALKTVYVNDCAFSPNSEESTNLEKLRKTLEPHGIRIVRLTEEGPEPE